MQHSPPEYPVAPPAAPVPGLDDEVQNDAAAPLAAAIEAVSTCRLPPFWRAKPDLWFMQAEAALQISRVRGDESKFNLVLSMLDPDTLSDIEDVIRSPPAQNKYAALKNAILSRLTDSADRQLLKLFTQLELGDKRPSQLLRHMRGLAGSHVTDEVLRVKWLDLLPVSAQRLLRILKTTCLEELAAMADEIVDGSASVASTSIQAPPPAEQQLVVAAAGTRQATPPARLASQDSIAAELSSIRLALAQLIGLNREVIARLDSTVSYHGRGRSQRPRSHARSRSPSAGGPVGPCHYHRRWGAKARNCLQPCSFSSGGDAGN